MTDQATPPLQGLKVLDLSTVVAGPLASSLLADFGAEVLKVELPGRGDGLRQFPPDKQGAPLWWKVANRNKRGITLDLRNPAGMDLLKRLIADFDVLVENFRPGTLDRWGLPQSAIDQINPKLTVLRISGFGQNGPYRNNAGFARVAEAMSGFTYICGENERPPMHCGFPISDSVTGLFGAFSILVACYHKRTNPDAPGEEIDLSLFDAMFRLLEFSVIGYDQLGHVRERSGNRSQYAGPSNVYRTGDGKWASISASTQNVFVRLAAAIGRPELAADPRFAANVDRVRNADDLDRIIGDWVAARDMSAVAEALATHTVAFSPFYSIKDIFEDPHVLARDAIVTVEDDELGPVKMQGVVPKFKRNPGSVRTTAPRLGEDNHQVFTELLGLTPSTLEELEKKGVI